MKEGKIICGFAGIGKSTLARNRVNFVDLESTPFEKDWKRYVKVAKHMKENGYIVLVSCHRELRKELQLQDIDYILALPPRDKKEEYLERYKERKNTETFVKLLSDNWDNFLSVLENEDVLIVDDVLEKSLRKEIAQSRISQTEEILRVVGGHIYCVAETDKMNEEESKSAMQTNHRLHEVISAIKDIKK